MLDIDEMIRSNDFTSLLHSTEEERIKSGGNKHLYRKLGNYMHFQNVREIAKYVFRGDKKILEDIDRHYK